MVNAGRVQHQRELLDELTVLDRRADFLDSPRASEVETILGSYTAARSGELKKITVTDHRLIVELHTTAREPQPYLDTDDGLRILGKDAAAGRFCIDYLRADLRPGELDIRTRPVEAKQLILEISTLSATLPGGRWVWRLLLAPNSLPDEGLDELLLAARQAQAQRGRETAAQLAEDGARRRLVADEQRDFMSNLAEHLPAHADMRDEP